MNKYAEFWDKIAREKLTWFKPWDKVTEGSFAKGNIKWFINGKLNASYNCLDRHLETKGDQVALIWEADDPQVSHKLTYKQLHEQVCLMANGLKKLGVKRGDSVGIYLPMIPEAMIAMLACARIGAIHVVVFAGFSAPALRQRLEASQCKLLITADGYQRGGKIYHLKEQADQAIDGLNIKTLLIKHQHLADTKAEKNQIWWDDLKPEVDANCPAEEMDAEDPLFVLYTSGSTGQPKGLVHTTGGYLLQSTFSFQHIFKSPPGDVFWCTADVGWITGHTYVVYGPLASGATVVMHEGLPTWPDPGRSWSMIDKHHINVFYTAPTAIRALKRAGDEWLTHSSRDSLRILGTVGEPINPEVWHWYRAMVGKNKCRIVDTWWQSETGATMICPQVGELKGGAACQPLPGVDLAILDEDGNEIKGTASGMLIIKTPWPGIARTIVGDHERYLKTYMRDDYYVTGDGAKRDEDGDYWIIGRIDDVLNVSGHRLGTAEVESALVLHPQVAEAAVVGMPHDLKGEGICAFVSLKPPAEGSDALKKELQETVQKAISPIAKPDEIYFVPDLPKTRSGKIIRRLLRQLMNKKVEKIEELGDLTTLVNPDVVEAIMKKVQ